LSCAGYGVRAVGDAPEALLAADACPPDVYVLDVRLPGMNGRDCVVALKSSERTRKPVLMISAEASGNDVEGAFEAGCDDFLAKAFRRSELVGRSTTFETEGDAPPGRRGLGRHCLRRPRRNAEQTTLLTGPGSGSRALRSALLVT
jgi:DNA-binding response OmpR family regulator